MELLQHKWLNLCSPLRNSHFFLKDCFEALRDFHLLFKRWRATIAKTFRYEDTWASEPLHLISLPYPWGSCPDHHGQLYNVLYQETEKCWISAYAESVSQPMAMMLRLPDPPVGAIFTCSPEHDCRMRKQSDLPKAQKGGQHSRSFCGWGAFCMSPLQHSCEFSTRWYWTSYIHHLHMGKMFQDQDFLFL